MSDSKLDLNGADKDKIIAMKNLDLPDTSILGVFGETANTVKGKQILAYLNKLNKPPRPVPENCVVCTAKTSEAQLPLYEYKSEENLLFRYRTFLVMGCTGVGKTTLLDAVVNCLDNISFTDCWRWKLVNENHIQQKSKGSQSQTTEITYYYIEDKRELKDESQRCHVKIIDSPGFGDTKGTDTDNKTIALFEKLFREEIRELDNILLVVKANESRWTNYNKYVFDRVQQIFGKDAKDRFIVMCTFADGAVPLCIETLQENKVVFEESFTFNNSAIYVPSTQGNANTKFFWSMAIASVNAFLDYVIRQDKQPMSLTSSREVIIQRNTLFVVIKSAQDRIKTGLITIEKISETLKAIKKNRRLIDENKDFVLERPETRIRRTPLGNTYQMCNICQITCCQVCVWPSNAVESQCTYFNGGRSCPRCPGRCPRSAHIRSNERIWKETVMVRDIISAKRDATQEGESGLTNAQALMLKYKNKMINEGEQIFNDMTTAKNAMATLGEIALKPQIFGDTDYFEQMIQQEEKNLEEGWRVRRDQFKKMQDLVIARKQLSEANSISDLFPQYKSMVDEASNLDSNYAETKIAGERCVIT